MSCSLEIKQGEERAKVFKTAVIGWLVTDELGLAERCPGVKQPDLLRDKGEEEAELVSTGHPVKVCRR